jgi:hypothetical protein
VAVKLADAVVIFNGDTDPLEATLSSTRGRLTSWLHDVSVGVSQGIGQALFAKVGEAVSAAVDEIKHAIDAASNFNESVNKIGVAFGDSADEILAWSENSATAIGQSQQQALEAASSFGLMFRSMGLGTKQAADMSIQLVQLAADLASINNISTAEALEKLQAGLVGEARPLRELGVLLSEASVQAEAMKLGLATSTAAISEQDKVLARYQLILDQTQLSQGDFARTSDQLANSQRILQAQLEDASATLGQFFLPVQLAFTKGLSDLITLVLPYGENIMDSFAQGLANGIIAILPVLAQVRALFVYWLQPHSPPNLLPELDEWGKTAMEMYLHGWTLADFSALESLGGVIEGIVRSFASSGDIKQTDLVTRIFGSQRAINEAINEFRTVGVVSEETFARIADSAGPAGDEVQGLVRSYFDLQKATKATEDAQNGLNDVTQRYADALAPINGQLDAVRAQQQKIRDDQRLQEIGKTLTDPRATADDKQLARLEAQEIQLKRQQDAVSQERDTAVDAAKKKVDAAQKEEDAQKAKFAIAQKAIEQQSKTNGLIAEETNLRQKLIDEGIAAQKKALSELEAQQAKNDAAAKKHQSELDRIADANLRWRLATTDTAGQLAIMQEELAKTTVGSAEYFDVLTKISNLQTQLQKEREKAGGGDILSPITDATKPGGPVEQASKGIQALSDALKAAFKTLEGGDGQTAQLNPAWAQFATTIDTIKAAVKDFTPIFQGLIDLVIGKDLTGSQAPGAAPSSDPFGDNWWLKGLIPSLNNVIKTLGLIRDGDWTSVWDGIKKVANEMKDEQLGDDPKKFSIYAFLVDVVIPAIDALRVGDWDRAWKALGGAAVESMLKGIIESPASQAMLTLGADLIRHDGLAFMKDFAALFGGGGSGDSGKSSEPSTPPSDSGGDIDWGEIIRKAIRDSLGLPNLPIIPPTIPQSFSPPVGGSLNAASLTPIAASVGATVYNYYNINQQINPSDAGDARTGASEGIRQALTKQRLTTA